MAFSSGTRGLLGEAMGWVGVACLLAVGIANFDDVKRLTAAVLDLPPPGAARGRSETAEPSRAARTDGGYELVAGPNGHFFTRAEVNGRDIDVMVDTGASLVALTYEDAERAGIFLSDADFKHRVNTANGVARFAAVMIDRLTIGPITVRNVQGGVSEPGKLQTTLLGMSFLGRLSKFDMRPGRLTLHE